ncbi:MAG TPA: hypothetical protein VFZ59_02490 [Verrucomicrobiae bacterium]|nr:hypothetical protein [Verrucomicrobiae bacterium]
MPFAKRKGEMLVVIGERLNWANAQIFAQLPAQWTILYCIAQLPRKSIEHLIQTKVVHPKLKLSEAKALVRGTASISSESSQDDVKRQFGRFRRWLRRASSTWTPAQRDSARQLWEDLHPIVAATPESPSIDVSNARTS